MGIFKHKQGQFVDELWAAAGELKGVRALTLPGNSAESDGLNKKAVNRRRGNEILDFLTLPKAQRFADGVHFLPFALIRLGRTGLLAAHPAPGLPIINLTGLQYSGRRTTFHYGIHPGRRALTLGRKEIAELNGTRPDRSIAEQHLSVAALTSTVLLLEDLGSPDGTQIVIRSEYDPPGRETASKFTVIKTASEPPNWSPEFAQAA